MSTLAAAFAPEHQHYLLEARQMQALSLAVHIPLVRFGIAFPAMVLFMEWLGMRTGDPLYRTVARWRGPVRAASPPASSLTSSISSCS